MIRKRPFNAPYGSLLRQKQRIRCGEKLLFLRTRIIAALGELVGFVDRGREWEMEDDHGPYASVGAPLCVQSQMNQA